MLTPKELLARLRNEDESVAVEAKRGTEVGVSSLRTISAFSNGPDLAGGYIIYGVVRNEDTGDYIVVGVDADKIQTDLASVCATAFNRPIRPSIATARLEDRPVVAAYIPEAPPGDRPIYISRSGLEHGTFRRVGSSVQKCTEDDLGVLFNARQRQTTEDAPLEGATIADFDPAAVSAYRRERHAVRPDAAELALSDIDMLQSTGAISRATGQPTLAGLICFGQRETIREFAPSIRVEYIIVPGREWSDRADTNYSGIDYRGPLLTLVPAVVQAIADDMPRSFSLEGELRRRDLPLVPQRVLREAVVNALIHRNYRIREAVQIIRFANRLEIRNPGHSLVPDDRLGEPGSVARNEKIAAVMRDAGYAETKGTGIRVMRAKMREANLTAPVFASDIVRDSFTVTLLTHHLVDEEAALWLSRFKDLGLSEDEHRALLVVREIGSITNAGYRDVTGVDTLSASSHLGRLRDAGLLEQRGKGAQTWYAPTAYLLDPTGSHVSRLSGAPAQGSLPIDELTTKAPADDSDGLGTSSDENVWKTLQSLAEPVYRAGKVARTVFRETVQKLCAVRPLAVGELGKLLDRSESHLRSSLRPLLRRGVLLFEEPERPTSPKQRYVTPSIPERDMRFLGPLEKRLPTGVSALHFDSKDYHFYRKQPSGNVAFVCRVAKARFDAAEWMEIRRIVESAVRQADADSGE